VAVGEGDGLGGSVAGGVGAEVVGAGGFVEVGTGAEGALFGVALEMVNGPWVVEATEAGVAGATGVVADDAVGAGLGVAVSRRNSVGMGSRGMLREAASDVRAGAARSWPT